MMKKIRFNEAEIYSADTTAVALTEANQATIRKAIQMNHAVGFLTGYYDDALTITYFSDYILSGLGYTYEEFLQKTNRSLRSLFYGENLTFLAPERFCVLHGEGEGEMLTKDGHPLLVHMYKTDDVDAEGRPMWVLSVYTDLMKENLQLVNQVLRSGFWSFDCDENGRIVKCLYSHDFRTMLGYHDAIDFPNTFAAWADKLHPDDRERVLTSFNEALQDRTNVKKYNVDYRLKTADGSYLWFRASADVNRRIDGTPCRIVGLFMNVTNEKRAQRRAQRSHAFHQAYTDANLCEYYLDLTNHNFDAMKHGTSLLHDYELQNNWQILVQGYIQDFVADEDKNTVALFLNPSYIEKKLFYEQDELTLECRIQLKGETRWVRNTICRDKDVKNAHCAIFFIRDITQAKTENAHIQTLTKKSDTLNLLLKGTSRLVDRIGICDFVQNTYTFYYYIKNDDSNSVTGSFSNFAQQVLEPKYKPLVGNLAWSDIFRISYLRKMLPKPDSIYRIEYATHDEKVFKSLAISPLTWENGKLQQVLLFAQNTTKEKRLERASRKALQEACEAANRASQAKTDFLSNMSHDIRTPMNAIVGMTAIAGAHIDQKERVQDCLGKITQASRHLLGLINEILDMSRIESGRFSLSEEDFNLSDMVDNLVVMNQPEMKAHHHTFRIHLDGVQHEKVCGDNLRLQQLMTNLLSNSIKYTPDGGHISLSISEIPQHTPGSSCYKFIIEDDGIGMSEDFQKVLFEPFTRADDKRTSQIQGTGLGMAISKNIAHMMNGDIEVESTLGKGTRFIITVSLKLQEEEQEPLEELIHLPVLVVDDDPISCENTVALLEGIGVDGESVTSGEEAIQRTLEKHQQNEHYFAIIIDWQMPGMDGIETARHIRKIVGPDVTIIILSAYDFSEVEDLAREAGVNEFIAKPLFRSRLVTLLQKLATGKEIAVPEETTLHAFSDISLTGKRFLLVEDNQLNSEIASEILRMTGATVDTAENGQEALHKFLHHPVGHYDLIFMDIQMPLMNGYEATQAIRHLDRIDAASIPIIAMTANAFAEDIIRAKHSGMNAHVAKPLDMGKLYEVLKKYL